MSKKRYLALVNEATGIGQIQEVESEELDGRYPYSYWEKGGMNVVKNCASYGEARAIVDWQESKNSEETGESIIAEHVKKVLREKYEECEIFLTNSQAPNNSEIIGAMKAIEDIADRLGVVLEVEHEETEAAF